MIDEWCSYNRSSSQAVWNLGGPEPPKFFLRDVEMTAVQVRAILESSGLQLTPETQKEISDRIGLLREMIDRVTGPHRRESEPATIFVVDNAR